MREAERREDEEVRQIIAARAPGAGFEPGSQERVAEVERAYHRLIEGPLLACSGPSIGPGRVRPLAWAPPYLGRSRRVRSQRLPECQTPGTAL